MTRASDEQLDALAQTSQMLKDASRKLSQFRAECQRPLDSEEPLETRPLETREDPAVRQHCEDYYKSLSDQGWPEDIADGFYVIECWTHGIRPLDP